MPSGTLGAALLALVVLTAGCLAGAAPATDADSGDAPGPSITVSATGTTDVAPDRAVVRIAVVATGEDPSAVRDDLSTGAETLRTALDDAGIDDVVTAGYSIAPDHRTDRDEPPRYRGVHSFTVTVEPDDVGVVVDAAADAGAVVHGVQFTLSEAARSEARANALSEAMNEARSQADVVASEADLVVAGVHSASTADVRYVPYEARADAGASTTVEPGPVTVTASVHVTYHAD